MFQNGHPKMNPATTNEVAKATETESNPADPAPVVKLEVKEEPMMEDSWSRYGACFYTNPCQIKPS